MTDAARLDQESLTQDVQQPFYAVPFYLLAIELAIVLLSKIRAHV